MCAMKCLVLAVLRVWQKRRPAVLSLENKIAVLHNPNAGATHKTRWRMNMGLGV